MRFGVYVPAFGELADPRALADLAVEAEGAGWDGIFLWDHIRFATDTEVADPWVALAAMATRTRSIRLGPLVTPLARRRVQVVARQATTLDHLSEGRAVLGVGLGIDEWGEYSGFAEAATDDRARAAVVDESITVLLGLWSGEPVTHTGPHRRVEGVRFLPRPRQRPRIPLWGAALWPRPAGLRRAAGLDGVMPFDPVGNRFTPDDVARIVALVRREREVNGVDPEGPFDVVLAGDPARMPLPELAGAGATWALDSVMPLASMAEVRRGVAAGPPR